MNEILSLPPRHAAKQGKCNYADSCDVLCDAVPSDAESGLSKEKRITNTLLRRALTDKVCLGGIACVGARIENGEDPVAILNAEGVR